VTNDGVSRSCWGNSQKQELNYILLNKFLNEFNKNSFYKKIIKTISKN
jgi:hypothetical protein